MMFVSLLYFVVAWAFLFICESLISFVILVILICFLFFFFFLSSRRRHTRLQDDWSSDVCSSDLEGLLDLIHTDVCGPLSVSAKGGFNYFITFTNDFSRYGFVYLMKYKSETFEKFKEFKQ